MKEFLVKLGAGGALVCFLIALMRRGTGGSGGFAMLGILLLIVPLVLALWLGREDDDE